MNAVWDHQAGMISTSGQAAASHTALTGVRVRRDTECHQREPGIAPSREKAKIWRVLLVMLARPQNNMAPITTSRSSLAAPVPSASMRICTGGAAELAVAA